MSAIRVFLFSCLLTLSLAGSALAEGFAMTEWSARGLGLAGGMVGRADDPSALAYNAAGITQLPGTQIMGGVSFIAPYGTVSGTDNTLLTGKGGTHRTTSTKPATWMAPHGYVTHQLNDNVWLGFAMFSRFGLGNQFDAQWMGRYNMYDVGLQTVSAVPTVAYKINDILSVSLGVELMYMSMYEGIRVPSMQTYPVLYDNDLDLYGQGFGFGLHAGLHAKFNEQWSAGLAYKSQVTQNIYGDAKFGKQVSSIAPGIRNQFNSNISGTLQLPDSVALGISYKPLDNLSFEVGGVWTRWSTYSHLNIYFDQPSGYRSLNDKAWKDGWNINASVEYSPLDWLTLRAGYWHESPVTNEKYADFMLPTNGRDVATVGLGFKWQDWKLDLAYAHIWVYPTDYGSSRSNGVAGQVLNAKTSNTAADLYSVSLSYTF